jgi:hypothetical protein
MGKTSAELESQREREFARKSAPRLAGGVSDATLVPQSGTVAK